MEGVEHMEIQTTEFVESILLRECHPTHRRLWTP
jgi:hypothetical protein